MTTDIAHHAWWIAGRSAGLVAFVFLTAAVVLGLSSAAGIWKTPGLKKVLIQTHQIIALVGLGAILTHGLLFLPDTWLHPSLTDIFVPFHIAYRPVWVGIGILSAYFTAIVSLSYYVRKRIGNKRWKNIHRWVILGWIGSIIHIIGSGTDATSTWLLAGLAGCLIPVGIFWIARLDAGYKPKNITPIK